MKKNIDSTKRGKVFNIFKTNIAASIILGVVLMLLLFSIVSNLIAYQRFSDEFTKEFSDNAFRIARAAEIYVFPDELDDYLRVGGDTPNYQSTYSELDTLCNRVNARFIYVIRPDEDYSRITFIFNTVNKDSGFEPYEIGYVRETTNDDYMIKYQRLYEGESDEELVVRDQGLIETGSHITAMKALRREDGSTAGILCVQRQMEALENARKTYFINMLIITAILIVAATLLFDIYLRRSVIDPIRKITRETGRFSSTPTPAEQPLQASITSVNEIGMLARSVDKMEKETLDYIGDITAMTAEKERIGTELEVAAAIQQGMLNSVSPERPEFDIFASMTPAKAVGGDFYDFFMIDGDHLGMVMADVSGKGVPAAMFMTVSKILLGDAAMVYSSPAQVLKFVNERICKNNKLDMFVTVWLGILEISTGKITASNAGHEYPAVYRSGQGFELLKDKHGFVIGGIKGIAYKDYTIELQRGDSLFLYTDGVPEAADHENTLYGTDRMIAALNIRPDGTPAEILETVKKDIDAFVGDADQFDDLTMMCLKYYGKDKAENGCI